MAIQNKDNYQLFKLLMKDNRPRGVKEVTHWSARVVYDYTKFVCQNTKA